VTAPEPYSAIVYSARGSDVRLTMVDGAVLVDEYQLTQVDKAEVASAGMAAARELCHFR
jgi:5-methylthioadenosine/S-adenosylhomocysteine deaminase